MYDFLQILGDEIELFGFKGYLNYYISFVRLHLEIFAHRCLSFCDNLTPKS